MFVRSRTEHAVAEARHANRPVRCDYCPRERQGLTVADEVQYDVGAVPTPQGQDLPGHIGVIGPEGVIDAVLDGGESGVLHVQGDHVSGGQLAEEFDRELTQATDSNDNGRGTRTEQIFRGADGVVRNDASIGKHGGKGGIEPTGRNQR
jgi:hypothetical protein